MYKKFNSLSDREQKLVSLALLAIVFLLIYLVCTKIPNLFGASIVYQVEKQQHQFTQLIPKITQLNQLKKQVNIYTSIPANNLYKYISEHQPKLDVLNEEKPEITDEKDHKVLIKYQSVGFDSLVKWLQDLNIQYGINVNAVDVTPLDKTGYVSAVTVLSLPA